MSIEAMAHVFRHPTGNASVTLVWLAMADSVNDQWKYDFWMSNPSLQEKTGLSESTVRRCLQRLVEWELIGVISEKPGHSVRYRFLFETPPILTGDPLQVDTPNPCQVDTQTQVSNPSNTQTAGKSISEQLWDALCLACKIDQGTITKTARGELNSAVKELKSVDATPREVIRRSVLYRQQFPGAALTPSALKKHWPQLVPVDSSVVPLYPGVEHVTPIGAQTLTEEEKERNQARIREMSERFRSERA